MGDIERQAREALELDKAATPGPWEYVEHYAMYSIRPAYDVFPLCNMNTRLKDHHWHCRPDIAHLFKQNVPYAPEDNGPFMAAARALLPALARVVLERGEVLRAVEWAGRSKFGNICYCPLCGGTELEGHAPDCALAKALRGDGNG